VAQLRREGLPVSAWLVGDGPRRATLEGLARSLGLFGTVHFLGHRRDVPAVCARASVGVLCSTAEGTSNAVMEGMAARLPMVVSGVGGSPDLIADGVRGRVVRPERPAELAQALGEVLSHPQRARAMGEAGRAYVARELTVERMVARHDAVYRAALAGRAVEEEVRDGGAGASDGWAEPPFSGVGTADAVGDLPGL
jgi:glycosyltransferase involved in cell wall biosynthesis